MDSSTPNITLKLVHKLYIISTQICLPLDLLWIHSIVRIPPLLRIYRDSTQLTSNDCKKRTNSYNFLPIIPVHVSQYPLFRVSFVVVIALLQPEHWVHEIFNHTIVNIIFVRTTFIHKNYRQRSHFYSEQWLSCACYLHSQLGFGRVQSVQNK